MNPSMKSYKVVIKFCHLPEYHATVKAVNAMQATDYALERHRLETGCGKDELYDAEKSTAVFAGKHIYLNGQLYCKPSNEGMGLRTYCGQLLGLPDHVPSVINLQSDLLRDGEATFFRRGMTNKVCYC